MPGAVGQAHVHDHQVRLVAMRPSRSPPPTVPASATTWKSSRRSSSATRPWRTTSWSSTTSSRSGRLGRRVRPAGSRSSSVVSSAPASPASSRHLEGHPRARGRPALDRQRATQRLGARPHVGQPVVGRAAAGRRVEAAAVIDDDEPQHTVGGARARRSTLRRLAHGGPRC